MGQRAGWVAVALVVLLVGAAATAADEKEAEREVWRFEKGDVERAVDVTEMPDFVREAVVRRLEAQGFVRKKAEAPREPGRDLAEDARTLARHGGRFPKIPLRLPVQGGPTPFWKTLATQVELVLLNLAQAEPGSAQAASARRALAAIASRLLRLAGSRGTVLGARVSALGEDPGWRVEAVPARTPAAALGLAEGDRILAADGRPATPETLATWQDPAPGGGQRTLRVLRTNGRRESWALEWIDRPSSSAPSTSNRR